VDRDEHDRLDSIRRLGALDVDLGELFDELTREAVAGGASSWFAESANSRLKSLAAKIGGGGCDPAVMAGNLLMIDDVVRRRSSRYDELRSDADVVVDYADALWRLAGN